MIKMYMRVHHIWSFFSCCLWFTCLIVGMLYCKEYHVPGFAYYECCRGESSKTNFRNGKTVFQLPGAPIYNKLFSDFDACFNFWLERRME